MGKPFHTRDIRTSAGTAATAPKKFLGIAVAKNVERQASPWWMKMKLWRCEQWANEGTEMERGGCTNSRQSRILCKNLRAAAATCKINKIELIDRFFPRGWFFLSCFVPTSPSLPSPLERPELGIRDSVEFRPRSPESGQLTLSLDTVTRS